MAQNFPALVLRLSPGVPSLFPRRQYRCPPRLPPYLQCIYYFPPLPPKPPIPSDNAEPFAGKEYLHEYSSGIMMAGKLIESMCLKPAKKSPYSQRYSNTQENRKSIPGWTDGSNAWRAAVYSFCSPKEMERAVNPASLEEDINSRKAYKGFVASPHRSRGVHSRLTESDTPPTRTMTPASIEAKNLLYMFLQRFS
jgi:hypothetical protein